MNLLKAISKGGGACIISNFLELNLRIVANVNQMTLERISCTFDGAATFSRMRILNL